MTLLPQSVYVRDWQLHNELPGKATAKFGNWVHTPIHPSLIIFDPKDLSVLNGKIVVKRANAPLQPNWLFTIIIYVQTGRGWAISET